MIPDGEIFYRTNLDDDVCFTILYCSFIFIFYISSYTCIYHIYIFVRYIYDIQTANIYITINISTDTIKEMETKFTSKVKLKTKKLLQILT